MTVRGPWPLGNNPRRWLDGIAIRASPRPQLTSWVICTAALSVYLAATPGRIFRYDSLSYLELSDRFPNLWSLTAYDEELRGYTFPWLLRLSRDISGLVSSNPQVGVRLVILALVPMLLCGVVPSLLQRISAHAQITVGRILTMNLLFFTSWRHDLVQPLSDVPAMFFISVGILALLTSSRPIVALAAGGMLAIACNMRPAYLLGAMVAATTLWLVEHDRRRLVVRTAALVAGALIVLAPQVAINVRHHHQWSPVPVASANLTLLQLTEGLALDRYDTYVGENPQQPPSMRFENAALENSNIQFDSMQEYARFVLDHPGDVAAAYIRHLINGLDTRFAGTYVEQLEDGRSLWPILNFTFLTLAVAAVLVRWSRRSGIRWRSTTTYALAVLAASCATSITGAMEVRFLLPLHLTLTVVLALTVDRSDLPAHPRSRALVAGGVLAVVAILFSMTASTMSQLQPAPLRSDGSFVAEN